MFSVADLQEAKELLLLACSTNARGEFVADELVRERTLVSLDAFSTRLDRMHDILREHGSVSEFKSRPVKR